MFNIVKLLICLVKDKQLFNTIDMAYILDYKPITRSGGTLHYTLKLLENTY